jgi:hypothetical protein
MQNPKPKSQIPNKFQSPNSQTEQRRLSETLFAGDSIGIWSLELVWDLEFGVWSFAA